MPIKINRIFPEIRAIYKRNEVLEYRFFGVVNAVEFADLCLQIKNERSNDFALEFEGRILPIHSDGYLPYRPNKLFDQEMEILIQI